MSYCVLETTFILYTYITNSINKTFLLLTDVPELFELSDQMYCLQYIDPFAGDLFMATNNLTYYSLEKSNRFLDSQLNYLHSIATLLQFLSL